MHKNKSGAPGLQIATQLIVDHVISIHKTPYESPESICIIYTSVELLNLFNQSTFL